eukprot:UN18012
MLSHSFLLLYKDPLTLDVQRPQVLCFVELLNKRLRCCIFIHLFSILTYIPQT